MRYLDYFRKRVGIIIASRRYTTRVGGSVVRDAMALLCASGVSASAQKIIAASSGAKLIIAENKQRYVSAVLSSYCQLVTLSY